MQSESVENFQKTTKNSFTYKPQLFYPKLSTTKVCVEKNLEPTNPANGFHITKIPLTSAKPIPEHLAPVSNSFSEVSQLLKIEKKKRALLP
ncbi:hypothetical protein CBS1_07540 [Fervidobacterium changbaicum]|uniref:Uncharacterized protein n=1 Tax=Fervidobacterium changbaicum TaxID=310769 RepID=A0ABX5QTL3_9BACT|nr:hypothetical protein CBS1_07540 [Fervidobacterium changbaicum]